MNTATIKMTDGRTVKMRLGDVFVTKSSRLHAQNRRDLDEFLPLALMPIAFQDKGYGSIVIYLFMASLYRYEVTVSRVDIDKGVLRVLKKGKEIEFGKDKVIESINMFAGGYAGRAAIKGVDIYSRVLISRSDQIKHMNLEPLNVRLSDLSLWPRKAVTVWASKQLRLTNSRVRERTDMIEDKREMIETILRAHISGKIAERKLRETHFGKIPINKGSSKYRGLSRTGIVDGMYYVNMNSNEFNDGENMIAGTDLHPNDFREYALICAEGIPKYIIAPRVATKRASLRFIENHGSFSQRNLPIVSYSISNFEYLRKKKLERESERSPSIDPSPQVTKYGPAVGYQAGMHITGTNNVTIGRMIGEAISHSEPDVTELPLGEPDVTGHEDEPETATGEQPVDPTSVPEQDITEEEMLETAALERADALRIIRGEYTRIHKREQLGAAAETAAEREHEWYRREWYRRDREAAVKADAE